MDWNGKALEKRTDGRGRNHRRGSCGIDDPTVVSLAATQPVDSFRLDSSYSRRRETRTEEKVSPVPDPDATSSRGRATETKRRTTNGSTREISTLGWVGVRKRRGGWAGGWEAD